MLAIERKQCIKQMIQEEKTLKVTVLSEKFGVTEETIRRDLEKLEQEGILKRTYGGAVICDFILGRATEEADGGLKPSSATINEEDTPLKARQKGNLEVKQRMAKQLVRSFQQGEVVMLDGSTTALEIAKAMNGCKNMTVISNSLSVITALSENERVHVISTGGILRKQSFTFVGPTAKENIKKYYADKVIISCKGANLERGIMDSNELEVEIKRAMMESAKEVILVIEHEKIGESAIYQVKLLSEVDGICTDKPLTKEWEEYCKRHDIAVYICDEI